MQADDALDQHYLSVLRSLSKDGQDYIAAIAENYKKYNLLAFSRVDLQSVGAEIPDVVEKIIQQRCDAVSNIDPSQLRSGLLMKDTITTEYRDFRK